MKGFYKATAPNIRTQDKNIFFQKAYRNIYLYIYYTIGKIVLSSAQHCFIEHQSFGMVNSLVIPIKPLFLLFSLLLFKAAKLSVHSTLFSLCHSIPYFSYLKRMQFSVLIKRVRSMYSTLALM